MERVQVKVTVTSSPRKRAKTWEISDSEDDEANGAIKGAKSESTQVSDNADDSPFDRADPKEPLRGKQVDEAAGKHDQLGPTANQVDEAAGEHDQTGLGIPASTAEPPGLQKERRDVHYPPSTSALSLPPLKSPTPSTGKRTRKKKSAEELKADRAQAEEKKKDQTGLGISASTAEPPGLQKEQRDVDHPPPTSALSLPHLKSLTPSPGKRTRKKKSPEELKADRTQAEEKKRDQTSPGIPASTAEPPGLQKERRDVHHPPSTSALSLPLPKSPTPSPGKKTKKKKSPEELEADRAQAEEKKREKEEKRQEKERIKNLEKEEREKRKESAEALKLLRPDQCGKYMIVQVDAGLLQDARSEDVLEALGSAGYNYSIEPHSIPWSITWRREMPVDWTCVEGLELCKGEEDQLLIVVEPRDFLKSVSCYIQVPESSRNCATPASVFGIDGKCSAKKITLVVLGLHDYRRCQRLSRKMERHSLEPQHCYDELPESHVTRRHIDEALVFLQLYHDTEVLFLDTWRELGQHVCAVTKSISQRPFRLHWDAQSYSFCTSAGTWRGWGPKGSLTGLPLAWRRQIQQLNRVSPAMAAVITEAYPSPQLLMQAYAACTSDKERLSLLSNLKVPRAAGTAESVDDPDEDVTRPHDQARERRIGPDLSRRIWLCMTSTNPELVLDLNS